jgi:hypothetical protein
MTPTCVSELRIDRLVAGELTGAEAAQARGHAASCPPCGALLADAEAVAREFAAARPPLRRPGRAPAIAAAAAIAAIAAVVVFGPWRDAPVGVRAKGRATLGVFVAHGAAVRRGQPGEVVAPGDRLQLVTTSERAGWLAVTGIDAAGVREVFAAPHLIAAGRDRALGFSIVLDGTRGPQTITAVFCPAPFALGVVPAGCSTDELVVEVRGEPAR